VTGERKYLYGPVPSRRLGLSFGVDIVPFKVCTLDCVYCQLGRTVEKTVERRDFGPVEPILAELREAVAEGLKADFVTIGGSGEPTLHLRLGELVDGIKEITDIPVALLTNGTLLSRKDVRDDCARVDVAMPSLDAGDQGAFDRIDRPEDSISIESVISGLCTFRKEYTGQIWLEIFFVEQINTGQAQIERLKGAIERIKPNKVQLNTAVRPTADAGVSRVDAEKLQEIATLLGPACEIIADFSKAAGEQGAKADHGGESGLHCLATETKQALLSMLKRRPCSLGDISEGLSLNRSEAIKYLADLQERGLIESEQKGERTFFKSMS